MPSAERKHNSRTMKTVRNISIIPLLLAVIIVTTPAALWARRYTNLPLMRITTADGGDITSKTAYKYCTIVYIDGQDNETVYDSAQIRGRGNSTWYMAKKPYRIKFRKKEKFLGKGYAKARSWTLLANAADKTMMRNALTSALGERLGLSFNPACRFVDLELNGNYLGTYQISDQVDVRPHRVDITEQDTIPADTADITGGYLLEADGSHDYTDGKDGFRTAQGVPIHVHSPDKEVIVPRQLSYIRSYVNDFETRLFSTTFTDPAIGYRALTDTASLINWYLVTEISANVDGFYSTYFYKDKGDPLLYWGPCWDNDIAYNNDNRTDRGAGANTTRQLMSDVGYGAVRGWVRQMKSDPWFNARVWERFSALTADGLEDYLLGVIDSLSGVLGEAQERNYQRWGISTRMYHEMVLYSSYGQYVADLRQFVTAHLAYLAAVLKADPVVTPQPFELRDYYYRVRNAGANTAIATSDGISAVGMAAGQSEETDEWEIRAVGTYYQLLNRSNGLALCDPTPTGSTTVGTQLTLSAADTTDRRQLWAFVPQGTDGWYNIINAASVHTVNLSNGGSADGTRVISWTSDSRNSVSLNRKWYFETTAALPTGITSPVAEPADYALAYNAGSATLHFGADDRRELRFTATVYDLGGRQVGSFRADRGFSAAHLPAGVYIVRWLGRSAKFRR